MSIAFTGAPIIRPRYSPQHFILKHFQWQKYHHVTCC